MLQADMQSTLQCWSNIIQSIQSRLKELQGDNQYHRGVMCLLIQSKHDSERAYKKSMNLFLKCIDVGREDVNDSDSDSEEESGSEDSDSDCDI